MAETIASRQGRQLRDQDVPMIKVDLAPYWSPPKGLNLTNRLSRLSPQECAGISNLILDDATLKSRLAVSAVGTAATNIMAVIAFVTPSQTGHLLRVTTTDLERWDGTSWVTIAAGIFTGGTEDYFSFAGWGNELLMTNGVDKVYSYNPVSGAFGFIAASKPAKHITVFGGRVVLTGVRDGSYKAFRIRWSVKNDNTDWSGDGSGYEDLFAAPGGYIDAAHGVFPVTDDTALIIRDNSIWQMSLTGNVLVPFRFSRVIAQVGTKYPRSIAEVPGGFAMMGRDNINIVGINSFQAIGTPVRDTLLSEPTSYGQPVAKYDFERNELRIAIGQNVYRYSFRDQGWTKDTYQPSIRDFSRAVYDKLGIPIDSLTGTIDALTGTIDDLSTSSSADAIFMVLFSPTSSLVVKEDPSATSDADVAGSFNTVATEDFTGSNGDLLNGRVNGDFSWVRKYLSSGSTDPGNIQSNSFKQTAGDLRNATWIDGYIPPSDDFDFSVDITVQGVSGSNVPAAFVLRFRTVEATAEGYIISVTPVAATNTCNIALTKTLSGFGTWNSGGGAGIASVSGIAFDRTLTHTLRVSTAGNFFTIYMDGVSVLTGTDAGDSYPNAGVQAFYVIGGLVAARCWQVDNWVVSSNAVVNNTIEIFTGLLQAGSPLQKTKVIECQLEYEADLAQTLVFEYSTDQGATWTQYSSIDIVATAGPQILSVRKTLVGHNMQLRVRSATLGELRIISFVPRVVLEAMVHP